MSSILMYEYIEHQQFFFEIVIEVSFALNPDSFFVMYVTICFDGKVVFYKYQIMLKIFAMDCNVEFNTNKYNIHYFYHYFYYFFQIFVCNQYRLKLWLNIFFQIIYQYNLVLLTVDYFLIYVY